MKVIMYSMAADKTLNKVCDCQHAPKRQKYAFFNYCIYNYLMLCAVVFRKSVGGFRSPHWLLFVVVMRKCERIQMNWNRVSVYLSCGDIKSFEERWKLIDISRYRRYRRWWSCTFHATPSLNLSADYFVFRLIEFKLRMRHLMNF